MVSSQPIFDFLEPCLLSGCSKALDRFKFRHDSVLKHLLDKFTRTGKEVLAFYADLNGWKVNGGTVPMDMALTEEVPDMVIIDKSVVRTRVVLMELTVPWDSSNSFKAALDRKTLRYTRLTEDLKKSGFNALNMPLEIGYSGMINSRNHTVPVSLCSLVGFKGLKKLRRTLSNIALLG